MYQVIDRTGQAFGPAEVDVLKQWAIERRLTPDMVVVDQTTGRQGVAAEMLLGMGIFLDPIPPDAEPQPVTPVQPVDYTFKGSNKSGEPPVLQTRAVAFFIDFLFGMMVYVGLHAMWDILFVRFERSNWTILGYVDYLFIPAMGVYFLLRDAAFPAQSIGKRIAKLKVVTTNGKGLTPMHSILRNIAAAPLFILPLPILGYLGLAAVVGAFAVECFMVMTTGKRLGDKLAMTAVVNA